MKYDLTKIENAIKKCVEPLTLRELLVLCERFGITNGGPKTLEEVGKAFGVTRERIRQLEAKALLKLEDAGLLDRLPEDEHR